ncbi:SMC-Scp complex subunit ScpB [Candidatus Woesearchaeota archaeon]|nr:SMC-Scp complex subunit ScpB [Candidatus Woesearchaeota archaeon]
MTLKNQVEAILFATGKRTSLDEISSLVRKSTSEVKKILEELQKDYHERDSALMITGAEGLWKIDVREKYLELCRNIISEMDLDKQTIETLAMIAYTQPCVQSEVIKRRTNKAYDHIKLLQEMGFITKEPYKRTRMIKLTQKFYDYFDVNKEEIEKLFDKFKRIDEKTEVAEQEIVELEQEKKQAEEEFKQKEKEKKDNAINIGEELNNIDGGTPYEESDPEEIPDYEKEEKLRLGLAAERQKRKKKDVSEEVKEDTDEEPENDENGSESEENEASEASEEQAENEPENSENQG